MLKRLSKGLKTKAPLTSSVGLSTKSPLSRGTHSSLKKKAIGKNSTASLSPKKSKAKGKLPSISQLKKEADALWSKYVRYRDGKIVDGGWLAQCITCDRWLPMKSMQCGHFISRSHNIVRFDEENTNAQCYVCNVMRYGEQYKYSLALDLKYGAGTAAKLSKMAQEAHQFNRAELLQIISDAKTLVAFYEQNN